MALYSTPAATVTLDPVSLSILLASPDAVWCRLSIWVLADRVT